MQNVGQILGVLGAKLLHDFENKSHGSSSFTFHLSCSASPIVYSNLMPVSLSQHSAHTYVTSDKQLIKFPNDKRFELIARSE